MIAFCNYKIGLNWSLTVCVCAVYFVSVLVSLQKLIPLAHNDAKRDIDRIKFDLGIWNVIRFMKMFGL